MSEATKLRNAMEMSAKEFQEALHYLRRTGNIPAEKPKRERGDDNKDAMLMTDAEWAAALRRLR